MLIEFDKLEETVQEHFRGGEGSVASRKYTDDNIKISMGRLSPGGSIGLHTHATNSEVIYIFSGEGKVLYDGAYETLGPGSCHYRPQGHSHSLINDGTEELCYLAVIPEHPHRAAL